MRVTKDKCDQCGLETEDHYAEFGWIRVVIDRIMIAKGRDKRGTAKSKCAQTLELDMADWEREESY